jgi:NAD(P)-dependent dehydrogenase (short-subunit alcohol dehydrogenase family)
MSDTYSPTNPVVSVKTSTWFITGINRGLGRNIAEAVLTRGGQVAGTVRRRADAAELEQQFPGQL